MFGQDRDITMCATLPEWNSIGRWVKPKSKSIKQQKESLCNIFDVMVRGNMNAACGQLSSDYRKSCYTASDITKEM